LTIDIKDGAGVDDLEEWDTPQEVAKRLKMDPRTVRRLFRGQPGVKEYGSDETLHKRKRKFMRISKSAQRRLGFL
jgi:methylphosphotriester-DNA--protein-cysteine methyltransferase